MPPGPVPGMPPGVAPGMVLGVPPGYGPPPLGAPAGFPTHPFARSPRDFFMHGQEHND